MKYAIEVGSVDLLKVCDVPTFFLEGREVYTFKKRQYWHCTAWDGVFLVNSRAFVSRGFKFLTIGFFKMQPNIVVVLNHRTHCISIFVSVLKENSPKRQFLTFVYYYAKLENA